MNSSDTERLNDLRVGILGCGRLGRAIAHALVAGGLEKRNLFLSYRGNPETYEALRADGLADCLTDNRTMLSRAGIVLIAIRPQELPSLRGLKVPDGTLAVSCMAGVSGSALAKALRADMCRVMFSGPDTLLSGTGVAAAYPGHWEIKLLFRAIRVEPVRIAEEADLDAFTAGVCLSAATLAAGSPDKQRRAIERIGADYPLLRTLYDWAVKNRPDFITDAEKDNYIRRMITKGGVTEAIINSLNGGAPLDTALRAGIARVRELAAAAERAAADWETGTGRE